LHLLKGKFGVGCSVWALVSAGTPGTLERNNPYQTCKTAPFCANPVQFARFAKHQARHSPPDAAGRKQMMRPAPFHGSIIGFRNRHIPPSLHLPFAMPARGDLKALGPRGFRSSQFCATKIPALLNSGESSGEAGGFNQS